MDIIKPLPAPDVLAAFFATLAEEFSPHRGKAEGFDFRGVLVAPTHYHTWNTALSVVEQRYLGVATAFPEIPDSPIERAGVQAGPSVAISYFKPAEQVELFTPPSLAERAPGALDKSEQKAILSKIDEGLSPLYIDFVIDNIYHAAAETAVQDIGRLLRAGYRGEMQFSWGFRIPSIGVHRLPADPYRRFVKPAGMVRASQDAQVLMIRDGSSVGVETMLKTRGVSPVLSAHYFRRIPAGYQIRTPVPQ